MNAPTQSIAIAGAWGYIGRKFLDAASALGLETYVFDPGEAPGDLALDAFTRVEAEDAFYRLDVDLFHLALHPGHRKKGLGTLLERARLEPIRILNEKPMAPPEHPEEARALIRAVGDTRALMLFDFPELFDSMTRRIVDYLTGFDQVEITTISIQRSKDREDPDNPRNYIRIVPIQYQETVHCIAFVLHLLGHLKGGLEAVFADGLSAEARAEPYQPPNPEAYPYVVDGKCEFALEIGPASITGRTDFKKGAPFKKQRLIQGRADGRPFTIEVDYLEGHKYLIIDGVDQGCDAAASSYQQVIETFGRWCGEAEQEHLASGLYPHPGFAHLTYQLSSLIWKSSQVQEKLHLASQEALEQFDAGFANAIQDFPRYPSG